MTETVDPLAGSYFVESLTDEIEKAAWQYLEKIDAMGGAVAAIEAGFMQDEITQAAYDFTRAVDRGDKVVVGVNKYVDDAPEPADVFPIDPESAAPPGRADASRSGPSATRPPSTPPSPTWRPPPRARRTSCRR